MSGEGRCLEGVVGFGREGKARCGWVAGRLMRRGMRRFRRDRLDVAGRLWPELREGGCLSGAGSEPLGRLEGCMRRVAGGGRRAGIPGLGFGEGFMDVCEASERGRATAGSRVVMEVLFHGLGASRGGGGSLLGWVSPLVFCP